MPKAKYSLKDTMADALHQTEKAKNALTPAQGSAENPSETEELQESPLTEQGNQPQEQGRGEAIEDKNVTNPTNDSGNEIPKQSTPAEKSEVKRTCIRNVTLDDETLFRLDTVKKRLNSSRKKGEPLISLDLLLYQSAVEWLDKNYPDTRELYKLINGYNI